MAEKRCKTLDESCETGAVLTNLSKPFDCIDHNLLIAKVNAYGFEKQLINFIYSYLTKRKQRTRVDSAVSLWEMLFSCVPQGFNFFYSIYIYIYIYIFFETPANLDLAGYVDDTILLTHTLEI